jgi:cell fate regulator YaaT (PSP1 superfamily)
MNDLEYLLSYGSLGDFGRFRAARPVSCRRGDRFVVRSSRGLEIAEVLQPATPRHARFLPNTTVGQLLRPATPEDDAAAVLHQRRGSEVLRRGADLIAQLGLELELLDVEMLLDGDHAVLHHLRWAECDVRPFVSALSREFSLHVSLQDLTRNGAAVVEEESHGCGSCGSEGGCGSCGSGGCGSCGSADTGADEVKAHFAGLRQQMERRTPLL